VLELSPKQIAILETIASRGFAIVAFPLYASAVGVGKGNCAALLSPVPDGGLSLLGDACWLVDGNLSVKVLKNGAQWFVWKKQEIEATPERLSETASFRDELENLLIAKA
jgi:hypothetical protein